MKLFTMIISMCALTATACSTSSQNDAVDVQDNNHLTVDSPENKKKERMDLMVRVTFENYDAWRENAFDPDSERRKEICDESKTVVSKVSDTEAIVLMYNVDTEALFMFMEDPEMIKLMEQANVTHEVFMFTEMK